jgi:regulator of sirC expression with transglutaminase-like and TPR domain
MRGRTTSEEFLRMIGDGPENEFDIASAALHLAALSRTRPDLAPFETHLAQLGQELSETFAKSVDESLTAAAQALTNVLVILNDYRGDDQTYDDLQNADLMNVIERRRGLPVALGILYIHSARSQGWHAHGLNFPGHFLVALEKNSERAIIDPFHEGVSRTPNELRELLKLVAGPDAELSAEMFAPASDRAVLLRLQSNIRLRLVQMRRFEKAVKVVESMLLFAPGQSEIWRDLGMLNAQLGNLSAAIKAFESSIKHENIGSRRQETTALLQALQRRMN